MKLLLNLPDYRHIHGGVTNHFVGLRPHWKSDVRYNRIGKRREGWPGILWLPYDYSKFLLKCLFGGYDVVMVNPSMNRKAWKRDAMFLRIARLCRVPAVVMFHGWSEDYLASLPDTEVKRVLNPTKGIFVLADDFRRQLIDKGVTAPILLTTTKVADSLTEGFDPATRHGRPVHNILFMARVIKEKGIYTTLEAFRLLIDKFPGRGLTLTIAGDGSELAASRRYVEEFNIPNVRFTGHIGGDRLRKEMEDADIYILPTTHPEGMATSVLEAMAMGLPVVSRPVGGVKDFWEEGEMGYLTESLEADDYADILSRLIDDPVLARRIGDYNHRYARRFYASAVAASLDDSISLFPGARS